MHGDTMGDTTFTSEYVIVWDTVFTGSYGGTVYPGGGGYVIH